MDERNFIKFVLRYIQKHGDAVDNEQASRMLSALDEIYTKSQAPQVEGEVAAPTESGPGEVAAAETPGKSPGKGGK